jgi:Asp-tRNA(Asn)/Glu-tRNA(Gln) amidotransferase A subunit family amidase
VFDDYSDIDTKHHNLSLGELALNFGDWVNQYRLFFRIKIIERIEQGEQVTAKELATARRLPKKLSERNSDIMDEQEIDLWVCPAAPSSAPEGISTTGDSKMNRLWTTAGVPTVTIPAGEINGLPMGLQCVGEYGQDEKLLADIRPIYDHLVAENE